MTTATYVRRYCKKCNAFRQFVLIEVYQERNKYKCVYCGEIQQKTVRNSVEE